jgi:hypothetical protein
MVDKLKILSGVSDYLDSMSEPNGRILCYKHKGVEHTGKTAYSVITDLKLFEITHEEKYWERALRRAGRVAENLYKDPESSAYIFYPGRWVRGNMSNSVIDAGGAGDSLATLLIGYRDKLVPDLRAKIEDALYKVCDTYLVKAVQEKELPDQRLWGATALSAAYRLWKKEEWKDACLASIRRTLGHQWPDGTFPYHPDWEQENLFFGMEETTSYYHSRQISFIIYILKNLDVDPGAYLSNLMKAGEILLAMYGKDGLKNIYLDTKRWYWLSAYEVASFPYDAYALAALYELTRDERYLKTASLGLKKYAEHQLSDGGITSNLRQDSEEKWIPDQARDDASSVNFQCRVFWNGQAAWLAKIIEKIPDGLNLDDVVEAKYFESADIIKYWGKDYSICLRGRKRPIDPLYGPPVGGGSILYFGRKKDGWRNKFYAREWQGEIPFNFVFYTFGLRLVTRMIKFARANWESLKSILYYAEVELRAGAFGTFLRRIQEFLHKIFSAGEKIFGTAWSGDVETNYSEKGVEFGVIPNGRDGIAIAGIKCHRDYRFKPKSVAVVEEVTIDNSKLRKIVYTIDRCIKKIEVETNFFYRRHGNKIIFALPRKGRIKISYEL